MSNLITTRISGIRDAVNYINHKLGTTSDSGKCDLVCDECPCRYDNHCIHNLRKFVLGEKDYDRMLSLVRSGDCGFLNLITVSVIDNGEPTIFSYSSLRELYQIKFAFLRHDFFDFFDWVQSLPYSEFMTIRRRV